MIEENAAENTDTRLWKDESGFQEVFVTREGAIGINHAGRVAVKTVPEWIKAVWDSDGDLPVPGFEPFFAIDSDKPDTGKNADERERREAAEIANNDLLRRDFYIAAKAAMDYRAKYPKEKV